MKDDPVMKDIFERSTSNAHYCSLGIHIKSANFFFAILTDETTDISRQEQTTLGLRFVNSEMLQIREEFIKFAVVEDLHGESFGEFILSRIEKLGLDMKLCRGQGYDGAPNMSGHLSGAQAFISSKYSLAKYVHCIAHSLNLVLTDSSKIAEYKHCMMVIRETVNLFHFSAKRSAILKIYTALNLKDLCKTRPRGDRDGRGIGNVVESQKSAQRHPELGLNSGLIVMVFLPGYTLNLSKLLQSENINMLMCIQCVKSFTEIFKEIRNRAEGRLH
ncbi:hypothetical protein QYM36_018569 [Artemia franciscana]|uniref:DUF4371 domain-containing protein n=1 Tax=Artemia franciscana TaxID=6661 RepID=A0AA88KRF3_ARTSF|nr:hypothetical protein QYM36_018569 [Artemia franciscana]